ncbi:MAG: hypothetical protein RIC55_02535 [Pirellulaceae bacterium]
MFELADIFRLVIEIAGIALFGMGIQVQPCCCGSSLCQYCQSGTTPNELEVTIVGLTDRECSDCETMNDTYILQWIGDGPSGCCWRFDFEEICSFDVLVACISEPIALGHQFECGFGRIGGTLDVIVYVASLGEAKPNCQWSNLNVPVTPQFQRQCHDDSSTCTVSAV